MNSKTLLPFFKGLTFTQNGPFLVAELPDDNSIPVGKHGMETVSPGETTTPHDHTFPSFYKSERLNVECDGVTHELPERAITLVLPGVRHSWKPKGNMPGAVGSIDHRHRKQKAQVA